FLVTNQAQRAFPSDVSVKVAQVPGVGVVSPVQLVPAQVDGVGTALVAVDPGTLGSMLDLSFTSGSLAALGNGGVVVDSQSAADASLLVGDQVKVQLPTGSASFRVVGVYEPAGSISGYVVNSSSLAAAGVAVGDSVLYVKADPGADLAEVEAAVTKSLAAFPTVQVQSQAEYKDQIKSSVNQVLLVMIMLLSLAIFIAILGIVNTLVLSVIERTREIGMLRAIGALRRQIRSMVVLEALVIAVYGAVIGLVLGTWFAIALQRTLVDQGIEVLDIPWVSLLVFLVVAAAVGVMAALWPAYRAGRLNVLQAISSE
ncbi:MAG: FtsX-like permease family protein, partial [Candidatus Nanopelagicales bacterium]